MIHAEIIKPALQLLIEPHFAGVNEEYLSAHEHYRHARYSECLVDCLKAFESIMKVVCGQKGWAYSPKDTASKLIRVCIDNGLFAAFMQTHIDSLRCVLESGVPTIRNREGGHGQGSTVRTVSKETAQFALHLLSREYFPYCSVCRESLIGCFSNVHSHSEVSSINIVQ